MKICIGKSFEKNKYYVYEQREDGLYYQISCTPLIALRGFSEEYMISNGFTVEIIEK